MEQDLPPSWYGFLLSGCSFSLLWCESQEMLGWGGGGVAALSVVGNSNAWKENWERRQKAEKNLGAEGKAVP